jgi:hypothetical protein
MAKKKCKAKGGPMLVAGNPNVVKEAKEKKNGDEGRATGGKVKRKTGGKVIGLMTGGGVRPRLDRPGRKSGGGVGANRSPLSTAHNTTSIAGVSNPADTYGGTPK